MRNTPRCSTRCSSAATDRSDVAMTLAAALPAMISFARLGPDSAPATRPGSTSWMTSVIRNSVPASKPFVRLTTGIQWGTEGAACSRTARNPWDGTPTTSTSARDTASSRSLVARRVSGRVNPDRYDGFSCLSLTAAATSGLRAHSIVGFRPALRAATVVPHEPAPSTVTRMLSPLDGTLLAAAARGRRPHVGRRATGPEFPQRPLRQRLEDQLGEELEVLAHHPLGREVVLHRGPARRPVELVDPTDDLGHVGLVGAEEAGTPVLDDFARRALVESQDGCPGGQGLQHHDPERFVPPDREQQGPGAGKEVMLLLVGHLAEEPEPVVQVRGDVTLEVPPLGRFPHLAGQDQPLPGLERSLQRPVSPLLGRHLAEEQEIAAVAAPHGEAGRVDTVMDHPGHRNAGHDLGLRGGHDDRRARHPAVEPGALAVERAMSG